VIFSSYLLSHNIGPNTSDPVRRTVYFRLKVDGHDTDWHAAVTDELHEFAPVRRAAQPYPTRGRADRGAYRSDTGNRTTDPGDNHTSGAPASGQPFRQGSSSAMTRPGTESLGPGLVCKGHGS
jgi:hypothetical protein